MELRIFYFQKGNVYIWYKRSFSFLQQISKLWVSEMGFKSKQRKKVINGREKHRKGRNKRVE